MPKARPRVVYIDSEPPSVVGGGIRTSILSAMNLLRENDFDTLVYTHNPESYHGHSVRALQRLPWPSGWARPLRRTAYRAIYDQAIAFGISAWLVKALTREDTPETRYEFCDYDGYAYHSLQKNALKLRLAIRMHTPHFMVNSHRERLGLGIQVLRWREMYCLKHAAKILAPSPHFAKAHFANLTTDTLYNIPPERPEPIFRQDKRELFPNFLYVGRWEWRKGLHVLLDAFARFYRDRPEAHLRIVGDPVDAAYAEYVKSLASYQHGMQNGWLTIMPGFAGPKMELYGKADILLVPSLWENAPYVFSEAMAHGLVALGSRTGDMIPAQEASHGLMPLPNSVDSWHEALNSFWQRRVEASEWRQKQWQWLKQRSDLAQQSTLEFWRQWPGQST